MRIGGEGNGCEAPPPNCFRCAPAKNWVAPSFPRPPDIAVRGCATHLKSRKRAHRARRGRRSPQCPRIGFRFAMGTAVRFMGGIVRPICRWGTEIFSRLIPNHFRADMGNECALAHGCGRCRLPMEIRCAHRREYKAVLALVDERHENKFIPLIANGFSFSNAARTVDAVGIGILSADFLFAFGLAVDCRSNRTLRHTRCHGSFKIRDGGVGLPGNTVAQQQCASVRSIFGETRTIAGSRGLTFTCPRLKHPKLSDYPSLRRGLQQREGTSCKDAATHFSENCCLEWPALH